VNEIMLKSHWAFVVAMLIATGMITIGIWQQTDPPGSAYHRYFGNALIIAPFLIFLLSKGRMWQDFGFSGAVIIAIVVAARLFWDYQDKPWFAPAKTNCDGDCYGWFSFENELLVVNLIWLGLMSTGAGFAIKWLKLAIVRWLRQRTL
jgi:hypothetical protein